MTTKIDHEALAAAFCSRINDYLTPEQIAEVNRRNATPEYSRSCASHDFCDANQAMLDALEMLLGAEYSAEYDEAINAAWDLAREKQFAFFGQ